MDLQERLPWIQPTAFLLSLMFLAVVTIRTRQQVQQADRESKKTPPIDDQEQQVAI